MPNSRRRRFSVHNGIAGRDRDCCKTQSNGMQSSELACELETKANNLVSTNSSKSKNIIIASSSRNTNKTNILAYCESALSVQTMKEKTMQNSNSNTDKEVTASSSSIDLFNLSHASFDTTNQLTESLEKKECKRKPKAHEETFQREKHREHRIKVRSPKRRTTNPSPHNPSKHDNLKTDDSKAIRDHIHEEETSPIILTQSTGTEVIDWSKEVQIGIDNCANITETREDDERQSDHSLDDMCRICHGGDCLSNELGPLISACACRGTVGRVHVKCLERWLTESGKSRCELCGTRYATRRVHRYGVPRALVMWLLSQNAKQLMVDSLGIMLMSPLAVLAAWLSGRTLAGLMTQDSHSTPWPLASTFVLACMTLVCYYCWIVSAATRHALGWWIWYKSQYEVRLTLDNEE